MFNSDSVEGDIKRLLPESMTTVTLRECHSSGSHAAFMLSKHRTFDSRVRPEGGHVRARGHRIVLVPRRCGSFARPMASEASRSLAIYEAGRISTESAESHAKSSRTWREQEHELVWTSEPLQNRSGSETLGYVAE